MAKKPGSIDHNRLDRLVAETQRERARRAQGYREQALKLYPWVCGRCGREFTHKNLHELTVHHRDHDHDHNPGDGSNWELLCLYCHDNEHQRYIEAYGRDPETGAPAGAKQKAADAESGYRPFEALKDLLKG